MIRALRRRFIRGAMLALVILIALIICGSTAASLIQFRRGVNERIEAIFEGSDEAQTGKQPESSLFGLIWGTGFDMRLGYYLVETDDDGTARVLDEKGIWDADEDTAQTLAGRVLATGKTSGHIDQYRFELQGDRLVLMDVGGQMFMLLDSFRSAVLLGLICLGGMFLILLPVSSRMVKSYAANIEKQKQFITNAGHEIKTPVAVILSNLDAMELIRGENKWSRNIRGQVDRLSALLQRLLFIARADEGSLRQPAELLDLTSMLTSEAETYREMVDEKKITLTQSLTAGVRVRANREYLAQLLHALLDNAVQYTPEGGRIDIRLETKRRRALLSIENSVAALPDCPPEALFDRFYRGDAAHTQAGGYGIGLSAARAVAEMYGGTVTANYLQDGVCFTAELPR